MKPDTPPSRCFQGVVPAVIATCSSDGTPNVTYLSQVYWIDDAHVALSCQFFNKTKENVLANPYASIQLYDPVTFDAYMLELHYLRAETSGPLFETMALRIQGIASHTGMSGIFKLISADVYQVLRAEKMAGFLEPLPVSAPPLEPMSGARSELRALQLIAQHTRRADSLESLLSVVLSALDEAFGFHHAMVLMPDDEGRVLSAVESRGYGDDSIGAEVIVGEGIIGSAAKGKQILRVSGVEAELRYGRAIRADMEQHRGRRSLAREVPLPGLPDAQSMMAMPLVARDRLVGMLAVESRDRLAFDEWDEAFLEIVASQIALAIDGAEKSEIAIAPASAAPASGPALRFRFFAEDDCVFVNDAYLIRNVPGRILWKLLELNASTGRSEFSNRELRLDPTLGLPALRDNLESRLVLLKKRLEQRCPSLRLVSTSRGHFRLEASVPFVLER